MFYGRVIIIVSVIALLVLIAATYGLGDSCIYELVAVFQRPSAPFSKPLKIYFLAKLKIDAWPIIEQLAFCARSFLVIGIPEVQISCEYGKTGNACRSYATP